MNVNDMLDQQEARNGVMDNYLLKVHSEESEWHAHEDGVYHSSTVGRCPRNNYYQIVDEVKPDESAYPHFELGHVLEDVFMDALKATYGERYVKTDVPISIDNGDWKIIGETDPVVVKDNLKIERIFEVKTTANLSYTRDAPKKQHLYQIHCYMKALDVYDDRASIVYINKRNLETQTHDVTFDPEIWNDIKDRVSSVHEGLQVGEPPEPVTDEEDMDYFCPFEEKCCKNF